MGLSLNGIYNSTSWAIRKQTQALSDLQEQATSGQVLNRPSDDPVDSHRVLGLKTDNQALERQIGMIEDMLATLTTGSLATQNITRDLTYALGQLTSGSTSSMPNQIAEAINGALEDILLQANWEQAGHQGGYFLFGGEKSDTPPYLAERDANGDIIRVTYQGSSNERDVEVAKGVEMSAVLVGDDLFRSDDRQGPDFASDLGTGTTTTGADAGTTASTVRGDHTLTIANQGGNVYRLSIDGGVTFVDVDITAGGADDVAVTHGTTGEILYVDTTGITQDGSELVRVPGTYDIFNVLISARDLLRTPESSLPQGVWDSVINETIGFMRGVEDFVTESFPIIGGRIGTLTNLQESLKDMKWNTEDEISRLQDADIAQVAMDLARHDVLYQMSLAVASKMFSLSLLDFIA